MNAMVLNDLFEGLRDQRVCFKEAPSFLFYAVMILYPVPQICHVNIMNIVLFYKAIELQQCLIGLVTIRMCDLRTQLLVSSSDPL